MKTKNRIISILLAAIMVLALVPFSAPTVFATDPEITEVGTWEELVDAINSDKAYVKLTADIRNIVPDDEIPTMHRLIFDGGHNYVLDLNGHSLIVLNHANEYYTSGFSMIAVSNNSNLEITNGSLLFENYYAGGTSRRARGVVHVEDSSTLVATRVNMKNAYAGTVVSATDSAKVTLDGGEYIVQSGFAISLERQASLTLDGDIYIHTVVGDSANTQYVDGYGALYSESTGELVINNAFFKSGIQVSSSQIGAFSTADHEVTVNGKVLTEDIFVGTSTEAKNQNKEYYWYSYKQNALEKTEDGSFSNTVKVVSLTKKYPIEVMNGTAKVNGMPVTEASYGQTVTIVADTPEQNMEFLRWGTSGVALADHYTATTTFEMPAAPVTLAAYYAKETVKSVALTVDVPVAGQKLSDVNVRAEGGVSVEAFEWFEDKVKMDGNEIFLPGKTYEINVLIYPPQGDKFDGNLTATVNGKSASVSANEQYAYITYEVVTLADSSISVVYNTSTAKLGIGGLIELDTALMASQSAMFKEAYEAGEVKYQWYRNGDAVVGATDASYSFTAEDVDSVFYATVTVGNDTAWGHTLNVHNDLYQIYLNASEIVAGGKMPQMSSATPGVGIHSDSLYISQGYGEPALDIQNTVLIPGKSYVLFGTLIQIGEANIPYGANVYVNGVLMPKPIDGLGQFYYEFTVPEADYDVYYKANGEIGIGVTLSVDVERMCNESPTFKNAYDAANPTYQTVFYQWYQNNEAIDGATDASYTVKTTNRDSYIHCKVTLVDGKYGIGEQCAISNVITVINLQLPYPKNGDTRIDKSQITADGVDVIGIMWWPAETGAEMQGSDTYVEGTLYEFYLQVQAKDTFLLDFKGDMTVLYVYGTEATGSGSVPNQGKAFYMGEVTAIHKHQYSDEIWNFDENGHWQPCVIPGCPHPDEEKAAYEAHSGGTADCETLAICEICHQSYGALGDHPENPVWEADADYHWHECSICEGQQLEKSAHADNNQDGKCDACEYQMPIVTPDISNTSDEPADAKGGLGTGAIVGIAVGSVAVVGIGGFALLWFVIKKKSFADLIAVFKK